MNFEKFFTKEEMKLSSFSIVPYDVYSLMHVFSELSFANGRVVEPWDDSMNAENYSFTTLWMGYEFE